MTSNYENSISVTKTIRTCPSCGHLIKSEEKVSKFSFFFNYCLILVIYMYNMIIFYFKVQAGIHNLPGLPAGVKFDPSDQEILEHLEAKVRLDAHKIHPLIDEFIKTLEGENGICYTHPEKLPGN